MKLKPRKLRFLFLSKRPGSSRAFYLPFIGKGRICAVLRAENGGIVWLKFY
jgi:hypothetical protein